MEETKRIRIRFRDDIFKRNREIRGLRSDLVSFETPPTPHRFRCCRSPAGRFSNTTPAPMAFFSPNDEENGKENADSKKNPRQKVPSRSTRRKRAKRQWLKEMKKIKMQNLNCESEGLRNWKEDQAKKNKVEKGKQKWKKQVPDAEINDDGQPKGLLHWMQSPQDNSFVKGKKRGRQSQKVDFTKHPNQSWDSNKQQKQKSDEHEQLTQNSNELEQPSGQDGDVPEPQSQKNCVVDDNQKNDASEKSNKECDEENEVVPIKIRPGHIHFEPWATGFRTFAQGDQMDVTTYYHRFIDLMRHDMDLVPDDRAKVMKFEEGLHPTIRLESGSSTLRAAYERALFSEQTERDRRAYYDRSRVESDRGQRRGDSSGYQGQRRQDLGREGGRSGGASGQRQGPQSGDSGRRGMRCFQCQAWGHRRQDCPTLGAGSSRGSTATGDQSTGGLPQRVQCYYCWEYGHIQPECSRFRQDRMQYRGQHHGAARGESSRGQTSARGQGARGARLNVMDADEA